MGPTRRFDPSELRDPTASTEVEVGLAYSIARQLEQAGSRTEDAAPADGFSDRVMAAVGRESAPRRAGFLAPLRREPGYRGLVASVRSAWFMATEGSLRAGVRAAALAWVLLVALAIGSVGGAAAYGAAGAFGWLVSGPSSTPPPSGPQETRPASTPGSTPESTGEPGATESLAPGRTPDGSGPGADASPTVAPDSTLRPSASPSPTSSHDDSASPTPSAGSTQTPKPSQTPKASETPKPSDTPRPTSASGFDG